MELFGLWQSGMVLQRNCENRLCGRANGAVRVCFCGKEYKAAPDSGGLFELVSEALPEGGPYTMEIFDSTDTLRLTDIYLGDVWLLGGQSNMQLPIARTLDCTRGQLLKPRSQAIRQFTVQERLIFHKDDTLAPQGEWMAADSQKIMEFSAAGYFFARELHERNGVPIGLIQTAIGGTPIEAWMPSEALAGFPQARKELEKAQDDSYIARLASESAERVQRWNSRVNENDAGFKNGWKNGIPQQYTAEVPGMFADSWQAGFCGSVWLQREFVVPESWSLEDTELRLGAIVDADEAYLNGVLVGSTGYRYPPRVYKLPTGVLKHGSNRLVVRVVCAYGMGGFVKGKFYGLKNATGEIELDGQWECAVGVNAEKQPPQTFVNRKPTGLFNGMVYPLRGTQIAGVAFYQGESNTDRPEGYYEKFRATVAAWRALFNRVELPFLYVQLANYDDPDGHNDGYASIREQQSRAQDIPYTGMAVTTDIGEYNDLHPQDKYTLGIRLAQLAGDMGK